MKQMMDGVTVRRFATATTGFNIMKIRNDSVRYPGHRLLQ